MTREQMIDQAVRRAPVAVIRSMHRCAQAGWPIWHIGDAHWLEIRSINAEFRRIRKAEARAQNGGVT